MQSRDFKAGVEVLLALARRRGPLALMCAETCYWQCHRCLLCDQLAALGMRVRHLTARGKPPLEHRLTRFACVEAQRVTYPPGPQDERAAAAQPVAGQKPISAFFKPAGGQAEQEQQQQAQEQQQAEGQVLPLWLQAHREAQAQQQPLQQQQRQQQQQPSQQQQQAQQQQQQQPAAGSGSAGKAEAGQTRLDAFLRPHSNEERTQVQALEEREARRLAHRPPFKAAKAAPAGIAAYFQPQPKRSKGEEGGGV
jgi:DNA polymerase III gamma/tau subunit